jgi:hypothetical protein
MTTTELTQLITDLAGDAIVIAGVVQALKLAGLPNRFAGVTALAAGVLWCMIDAGAITTAATLQGIVTGLSATGSYELAAKLNAINPLKPTSSAESADTATTQNSTVSEVPWNG